MRTVKEMSVISGVSVRTLHYYDEIGLLKPAYISQKGYRYYDEQALKQLQKILLFRELKFPLKEIRRILENEKLDEKEILAQQIKLLELERKHLNEIIAYAYQLQEGGTAMDFSVFDKKEWNQYAQEVKERWGDTEAYQEYEAHTKKNKGEGMEEKSRKLMAILADIGQMRDLAVDSIAVKNKVAELQQFISDNFYTCTTEILQGLGQMYVADERFKRNIDQAGGVGSAEFISRAIACYCKG